MFKDVHKWIEIRRRVLGKEISKRQACREYAIGWRTLARFRTHEEPPGYRLKQPRQKEKLQRFLPGIHEILEADQQAPRKQRHAAQRISERLAEAERTFRRVLSLDQQQREHLKTDAKASRDDRLLAVVHRGPADSIIVASLRQLPIVGQLAHAKLAADASVESTSRIRFIRERSAMAWRSAGARAAPYLQFFPRPMG